MADGYVPAWRKLFEPDHNLSMGQSVCPRFAWLDLCQMATRTGREVSYGYDVIDLEAGELVVSVRTLAKRWKWSKSRVQRFLTMLENRDTLRAVRGTPAGTVYHVENKDTYWPERAAIRDTSGTPSGTGAGQERDKIEGSKGVKNNSLSLFLEPSEKRGVYSEPFEELWAAYDPRHPNDSKARAWKAYGARIRSGVPHAEMLEGAMRYIRQQEAMGKGVEYRKHLSTLLGPEGDWRLPFPVLESSKGNDKPQKNQRYIPGVGAA